MWSDFSGEGEDTAPFSEVAIADFEAHPRTGSEWVKIERVAGLLQTHPAAAPPLSYTSIQHND